MGHTDPFFMIPAGTALILGCLYMLVKPATVHDLAKQGGPTAWPKTLERLFGRRGALWVLRGAGLVTAILVARPVVHASQSLLGT